MRPWIQVLKLFQTDEKRAASSTQLQLWTEEKTSLEISATQHRKSHGSALHAFPSVFFADRTPKRLELTLEVAEGTLNRSAEVLQTITPISKKVEKWANNMRNKEYSTTAYEQAVLSAGEAGAAASDSGCWLFSKLSLSCHRVWKPLSPTVENLNVLVPELLDKLKVVEEKKPVSNVTTNILRIRELIAQARSVAKKVSASLPRTEPSSLLVLALWFFQSSFLR